MYLLDTHALIWALYDKEKLPERVIQVVRQESCCVSIASLWEMAIKIGLGKLALKQSIGQIASIFQQNGIPLRSIIPEDCDKVIALPLIHRDPFDRLLVAQAMVSSLTILTKDEHIPAYGVQTLWD